jgi:osmotically-inducible protein OsmY
MRRPDEEITRDLVDQLAWDSRIDASRVTVEVTEGRVTLGGSVSTYSARQNAFADASMIQGVTAVDNHIAVVSSVPAPADLELESTILELLEWSSDIDIDTITVWVKDGHVTLEGTVGSYWQKDIAEDLVAKIKGVLDISDKLTVVPTMDVTDETISHHVVSTLERNLDPDSNSVDVKVQDGVVTLTGTVSGWPSRQAAGEIARQTGGVRHVNNVLMISAKT